VDASFHEQYARLNEEELLHIAGERKELCEEAAFALDAEMSRRGLTQKEARAKKRDELRLDINEAKQHRPRKSKYFVAQISLRWFFIGIVGLMLLLFALPRTRGVLDDWSEPIAVMYTGALLACLSVQPWVRQAWSFWLAVAISCVPEFFVSHWLTVYHPAQSKAGSKGSWFVSLLAGYVVGCAVFVLLQKLKLGRGSEAIRESGGKVR
jgi:hypothetical protein